MRVRAMEAFTYDGIDHAIGDEFDILDENHLRLLKIVGRIVPIINDVHPGPRRGRYKRADLRPDE